MKFGSTKLMTAWQMFCASVWLILKRSRELFQVSVVRLGQPDDSPSQGVYRTPDNPEDLNEQPDVIKPTARFRRLLTVAGRVKEVLNRRRPQLMMRWSLFMVVFPALFWGTWYLMFGQVPTVSTFDVDTMVSLPWLFPVSRWWDILAVPLLVLPMVYLLTMPSSPKKESKTTNPRHLVMTSVAVGLCAATIMFFCQIKSGDSLSVSISPAFQIFFLLGFMAFLVKFLIGLETDREWESDPTNPAGQSYFWSLILGVGILIGLNGNHLLLWSSTATLILLVISAVPIFGYQFNKTGGFNTALIAGIIAGTLVGLQFGFANGAAVIVGLILISLATILMLHLVVFTRKVTTKASTAIIDWLMVSNDK